MGQKFSNISDTYLRQMNPQQYSDLNQLSGRGTQVQPVQQTKKEGINAHLEKVCEETIAYTGEDDDDKIRYLIMLRGKEKFEEFDVDSTKKRKCSLVQSFWRDVTPGEHPLTRRQSDYTHDQLLYVDLLYFAFLKKRAERGQIQAGEQVELTTLTDYFEHLNDYFEHLKKSME